MSTISDLDQFAHHLRDFGDRLPTDSTPRDLGFSTVDQPLERNHRRPRRPRMLAGLTAAAVVGVAITAGIVGSRSDDQPQIGTQPTTADSAPPSTNTLSTTSIVRDDGNASTNRPVDATIALIAGSASVTSQERPTVINGDRVDVSASMPAVEPSGDLPDNGVELPQYEWLVEWRGGFLLGRVSDEAQFDEGQFFDAQMSPNGLDWTRADVSMPPGFQGTVAVTSATDRLVATASAWIDDRSILRVATTSDLTTWSSVDVHGTDPTVGFPADTVTYTDTPMSVVATEAGWALHLRQSIRLDIREIADRLGYDGDAVIGSARSGGFVELRIDTGDGRIERVPVSHDELGLTEGQTALIDARERDEIWIGGWDDRPPQRVADVPPGRFVGVQAFDGGIVMWTTTHIGVLRDGDDVVRSYPTPPGVHERYSISTVLPDGANLVMFANDPASGQSAIHRFDVAAEEWVPLDLPTLPPTLLPEAHRRDDAIATSIRYLPPTLTEISTVDVGDLRYTATAAPPFSSYTVERISDGELMVSESSDLRLLGDWRELGDRYRQFQSDRYIIVDPATGDTLMEIVGDDLQQLSDSRQTPDGQPIPDYQVTDFTPFDFWLAVPTADGWLIDDLPEPPVDANGNPGAGPGLIARSGEVTLVQIGGAWFRFEAN